MASETPRPQGSDGSLSLLNAAIEALNLAKEISSIIPAKAVFGAAGVLLTMIRVRLLWYATMNSLPTPTQDTMVNEQNYVELGLSCADVCQALQRGLTGRQSHEPNPSVLGAIGQLTT